MKDQRVVFFRNALEALLESLDATVRVTRWDGVETIPAPLQTSADKLQDRLGTSNRLAAGRFVGTAAAAAQVGAMCEAMQRLDTAYVTYRQKVESIPAQTDVAATALETEIHDVKADAQRWA